MLINGKEYTTDEIKSILEYMGKTLDEDCKFKIGDRVWNKHTNKTGTITEIKPSFTEGSDKIFTVALDYPWKGVHGWWDINCEILSKTSINDCIEVGDTIRHKKHTDLLGTVISIHAFHVRVECTDGSIRIWNVGNYILISKKQQFKIGDEIKHRNGLCGVVTSVSINDYKPPMLQADLGNTKGVILKQSDCKIVNIDKK